MPEPLPGLDLTLPSLEANLALDEALLEQAAERSGPGLLRFWLPPRVAVVLGASGKTEEDVRLDACRADNVPVARRASGGGTVVIGPGVVNATVVLPLEAQPEFGAVDLAQLWVLGQWADALRPLCPGLEVKGSGDLAIGGRKVAGSAQRRIRGWMLVHTTLLCAFDLSQIDRYTTEPKRRPEYRKSRPHNEFVTNLGVQPHQALTALAAGFPACAVVLNPDASLIERTQALVDAKYGQAGWVYRF